ncbi:MAG: hypothetical protein ACI4XM_00110 [Candidatus Coprovivens sp.]
MGKYHNKLDKKYFDKSIYMKKFESAFNINSKDEKYKLQYELVFETYNTFISFNNLLFTLNYMPLKDKVKNSFNLLNTYVDKYKNKIKKCYDSNCIMLYDNMEIMKNELEEILKDLQTKRINKPNLKPFENAIEEYMNILINLHFDKLVDSKDLPYEKKANDKLPKKVNLKIINDLDIKISVLFDEEKQKELNNKFINDYFKITGIDLNEEKEQRDFVFDTLNRIKDINNAIVDYYIYKDKAVLNIINYYLIDYLKQDISFVKDITYINVFNKLKDISKNISDDDIDLSFEKIKDLINQFKNLYERMS